MTNSRTYQRTHPWLSFQFDLDTIPRDLWCLLGECQSRCDHIARMPLKPSLAKRLHNLCLARGALASVAIEGNTLTEDEAIARVEGRGQLPASQEYLGREIDNIISACGDLPEEIAQGRFPPLSVALIKECNRRVLDGLEVPDEVTPGEIRHHRIRVGRYIGPPIEDCEYLLDCLVAWLPQITAEAPAGTGMAHAIIQAILAHLHIAWIHPFGDGNGRTARLIEFLFLLAAGVPSPAAHLLSSHWNKTRAEYYRRLDHASVSAQGSLEFCRHGLAGFHEGLGEQIESIWRQIAEVAWTDFVDERFRGKTRPSDHRRCLLIKRLGHHRDWALVSGLTHLSPPLAEAYARKTAKTLTRDLNELEKMGLLERGLTSEVRAKVELMNAFRPQRIGHGDT